MQLGPAETISEDEYMRASSKYQGSPPNIEKYLTPSEKTISSISGFDNSDKGKYLYIRYLAWGTLHFGRESIRGKDFEYGFSKYEIASEIQYRYIKVKIVDDDTIIIKNSQGETTYNVSSYSISYFK